MNLRKLTLSLTFTLIASMAAATAHAQLGVYGTFTGARLGGLTYSSSTEVLPNRTVNTFGGTAGLYYDFRTVGPVKLGVDLRGSLTSSKKGIDPHFVEAGAHLNSALAGVRAVFHTPFLPLRPYVQASAGLGRVAIDQFPYNNHLQFQGFGGLDVTVFPFMDVRVFEYGAGAVRINGGFNPIQSVSTGIVFHLPF